MPQNVMYLGQAAGAGVLAVGGGVIAQVGTDYQMDLTTWDLIPAGVGGDCLFRTVDVALDVVGGYSVGVTPIIDGVSQSEQTFSGGDTGTVVCQAFVAVRGAKIRARVRTLSRVGAISLHDIRASFVVLRETP